MCREETEEVKGRAETYQESAETDQEIPPHFPDCRAEFELHSNEREMYTAVSLSFS